MERLVFHVDVNSAYLSWAAAQRVAEGKDDLRLIPSAVGGDPQRRTGVILAKSLPAKRFGVRTGEPVAQALRKCPQLVLVEPDFKLYTRNSRAFMDICRRFAPVVEPFSIDECFLDMTGTGYLYPDPVAAAHTIKDTIRRELGFTVNIGVADNRLLAKMASDFEKPDRVHTLFRAQIPEKLWPLPVGALFSVGQATAKKLEAAGVRTIGDLAAMPLSALQPLVGNKWGEQLHAYANGLDDSPVSDVPEQAKGYSVSTTLEADVTEFAAAHKILLALADSVSSRLRADGARAACVAVTTRTAAFEDRSHQKKLAAPTDVTNEIYAVARRLLSELWDGKTPLRLLGLSLTQIDRSGEEQLSLFADEGKKKAQKLDRALDQIRGRYGLSAVQRGATLDGAPEVGKKYKAQLEADRKKPE